jgi:hypothetical protein
MALRMASVVLLIFAFGISAQTDRNGGELMENSANATPRIPSQSRKDNVKEIIVELDRAYQGAVKNNDMKTMARILADDFVLVTGKGKSSQKKICSRKCAKAKRFMSGRKTQNKPLGSGAIQRSPPPCCG